jgi:hypothetical protein
MSKRTKKNNPYLGKAGHLYVMSELLTKGWNVAIPEVDVGDDVFVVDDAEGILKKVQVKTSTLNNGICQFSLSSKNLENFLQNNLMYYIFLGRDYLNNRWTKFVIIKQEELQLYHTNQELGSVSGKNIIIKFRFKNDKLYCKGQDFSTYLDNFSDFPIITH